MSIEDFSITAIKIKFFPRLRNFPSVPDMLQHIAVIYVPAVSIRRRVAEFYVRFYQGRKRKIEKRHESRKTRNRKPSVASAKAENERTSLIAHR